MLDQVTFCRYVRETLARLDDRPFLTGHPLASALATGNQPASPEALRRFLLDAIEETRPPSGTPTSSVNWRRWRCLALYHEQGASIKDIARELLVSDRQARRDHLEGIDAVAAVLWERYRRRAVPGVGSGEVDPAAVRAGPTATGPARALASGDLETELARVSALSAGETTGLSEALESALVTVHDLAEARQARIQVSFPEDLQPIAVGQPVLRQILLCLLTAVVEGLVTPKVAFAATDGAESIQVLIEASGRGQLSGATSSTSPQSQTQCWALLDAARRLVDTAGGTLRVETSPNGPCRLALTLPARPSPVILVIDDNPDVVELFRWYLAQTCYRLVQARTPPVALELARELRPDVITLDVMMPSQDGWQILQQLRADPATREIPVIVCSVLPEQPLAKSMGVAGFLAKPVTREALLAAVAGATQPWGAGNRGTARARRGLESTQS